MIKLRKLEKKDLPTRVTWMNDPRVYRTMHFKPPISLERTLEWFHNRGTNRLDFVTEEDGELLAMVGATNIDPIIKKGESYTIVNPDLKGRGIGTKALFLKSVYCFEIERVNKIWAYVDGDNTASIRMAERIGYRVEGILRQEVARENGLIDRYYLGCLENDLKKDSFKYGIEGQAILLYDYIAENSIRLLSAL